MPGRPQGFNFHGKNYEKGAPRDRQSAYAEIAARYPNITMNNDNILCQTNHLEINRYLLNKLRKDTKMWRLRGA